MTNFTHALHDHAAQIEKLQQNSGRLLALIEKLAQAQGDTKEALEEFASRIDQQSQRIEELSASLTAAGAAALSMVHTLLARTVLESSDWRAALADVCQSAELELGAMPIEGEHAEQIREFALGLLRGSLNNIGDAAEEYDAVGRPGLEQMSGLH